MLFHLARFSLFMLVVMVSFALAFFSLYNTCDGDLFSAFGTMGKSMISMFTAMIGGELTPAPVEALLLFSSTIAFLTDGDPQPLQLRSYPSSVLYNSSREMRNA